MAEEMVPKSVDGAEQMVVRGLKPFLDYELFQLGGQALTVGTVVAALVLLAISFVVSRMARSALTRAGKARGFDTGKISVINRLMHYGIIMVGVATAVETLGFDLSAMFAAGAVFAVGIGFAMQTIAEGFVAGLILLVEGAIKPGDVLEIDGLVVKVEKMNIRSTIVRTPPGIEIILPNSELVKQPVRNLTLSDRDFRVDVTIGVSYDSDMKRVKEVLTQVTNDLPFALPARGRRVRLMGFGSSSVDWMVSVWTRDPWERPNHYDDIYQASWDALLDAGITIAYPQLDVHLDTRVVEAMERAPGRPRLVKDGASES